MPDLSIAPYIGAGIVLFLLALGFLRIGLMGAWPLVLVSLACLGVIAILPTSYRSGVAAAEWVKSLEGKSPDRDLTEGELLRFGPSAEGGEVFGSDDAERRLYCVHFRDGSLVAALEAWKNGELQPVNAIDLCAEA